MKLYQLRLEADLACTPGFVTLDHCGALYSDASAADAERVRLNSLVESEYNSSDEDEPEGDGEYNGWSCGSRPSWTIVELSII